MNKCAVGSIIAFSVGAAIGSLITWKVIKVKYEKLAQEEIDSVKEKFTVPRGAEYVVVAERKADDMEDVNVPVDIEENHKETETVEYNKIIETEKYTPKEEGERKIYDVNVPYVITAEEFGEDCDHLIETFFYFRGDGVITDDQDDILDDVEDLIGSEWRDRINDEEDCVYVRNDKLETDYEIIYDTRTYAEYLSTVQYERGGGPKNA